MVVSIFSKSINSIKLFFIMCDASGRQKSEMATHQREILMFVSRHLGFLTYLASHTVQNSFSEFFQFNSIQFRYLHAPNYKLSRWRARRTKIHVPLVGTSGTK